MSPPGSGAAAAPSMRAERYVICEGYDDRAFWSGWLLHHGCTEGRNLVDSRGSKIKGSGKHAFESPSGGLIVVCPAGGKPQVRTLVEDHLKRHVELAPEVDLTVVVCVDRDQSASQSVTDYLTGMVRGCEPEQRGDRRLVCDGVKVDGVVWEVPPELQAPDLCLPTDGTLELVIATALARVHPDAAQELSAWLQQQPERLTDHKPNLQKRHVWSFFGKWFTHQGPNYFLSGLWEDERIAQALEDILKPNKEIIGDLVR